MTTANHQSSIADPPACCMACVWRHYIFVPPSRLATVCGHADAIEMAWEDKIPDQITDVYIRPTWCPLGPNRKSSMAMTYLTHQRGIYGQEQARGHRPETTETR